jgi:hypothetical protein
MVIVNSKADRRLRALASVSAWSSRSRRFLGSIMPATTVATNSLFHPPRINVKSSMNPFDIVFTFDARLLYSSLCGFVTVQKRSKANTFFLFI